MANWNAPERLRPGAPSLVGSAFGRLPRDQIKLWSPHSASDTGDAQNGAIMFGSRAIVVQQKTGRPVQFELLDPARSSILAWLERRGGTLDDYVFPSRIDHARHISTQGD